MANDDVVNPRRLDSYFWLRAETGDISLKKGDEKLSDLIENHLVFQMELGGEPYFNENHFSLSNKWNIPFWSQKPSFVLNNKKELERLVNALSVGWAGYDKPISFRGAAIELDNQDNISRLKLTFNGEGQRVYDEFSEYMSARMAEVDFITKQIHQVVPYIGLAKKYDSDVKSDIRREFSNAIERRFPTFKTDEVKVDSLILGQVLCSSTDRCKGRRDVAKIHSSGSVEWLFKGNPFDNRANYKLVNPDMDLTPA